MSTTTQAPARDLDADLAICEATPPGPWKQDKVNSKEVRTNPAGFKVSSWIANAVNVEAARFIAAAREGWPYAIRRAMAAEAELDRIRDENAMLQEQLQQQHHRSHCYD